MLILIFLTCAFGAVCESMLSKEPCLDINQVQDLSKLALPKKFGNITPPWLRNDKFETKVFKSLPLQYQWGWMKSLTVRGLKKKKSARSQHTIDDVLNFVASNDCLVIPTGPTVRDLILRKQPGWLRAEVSCDISMLYKACIERYGNTPCALYPVEDGDWGEYRLEIGDASVNNSLGGVRAEPISFHSWGTLIGNTKKWSYTIEELALLDDSQGEVYLLDLTGKGFDNTCEKKLIPASVEETEEEWDKWSDNSLEKLLASYDLRANTFRLSSKALEEYISRRVVELYNKKDAQTFYCERILGGVVNWAGEDQTTTCHVVYPNTERTAIINGTKELMKKDLGQNWEDTIGTASEQLEDVYVTDSQYVDVKNRMKHRITSDVDVTPKPMVTTVIRDGKPMINDISDVHRRPIMKMSEPTPALPSEFPSAPHAKPDEHLKFHHIETSGEVANDPVAYETIHSTEVDAIKEGFLVPQNTNIQEELEQQGVVLENERPAARDFPRSAEVRRIVEGELEEYDVPRSSPALAVIFPFILSCFFL